jgi:hypothetical protein
LAAAQVLLRVLPLAGGWMLVLEWMPKRPRQPVAAAAAGPWLRNA